MRRRGFRPAVAILLLLGSREATPTQWTPRPDIGVAAVDGRTGSILWEAWDETDLPPDATAGVRGAAAGLLAQREPTDPGDLGPHFPPVLAPDRVVKYFYDAERNRVELILACGSAERPGEELARFTFASAWASYALGPETFYVLTDGRVHALGPRGAAEDGTWRPDWTADLVDPSFERGKALSTSIWTMRVEGDSLWVADDGRIRRFGPGGRLDFEHVIRDPWVNVRNGFAASVTLGERTVYFRHGRGVIAVDRATSRELWRVPTFRSPYPSRILEAGDLVLVQVGSNCPQTILDALGQGAHPAPRSGPGAPRRLVAATTLLRTYGDGYPRAELRRWATRVRRGKASRELRRAATSIERLLESWPAARDRQRLIDHSVDSLLVSTVGTPSWPAVDRTLTWTLLQELIYGRPQGGGCPPPGANYAFTTWDENPLPLSDAKRRALARECRRTFAEGPVGEKGLAAGVLLSDGVGWSSVTDPEISELFLSKDESVWRWAGLSLAKHGRRDDLVELAGRRPEKEHLSVIYMLANVLPPTLSEKEKQFWIACVKRTPASVAYVLVLTQPAELPREYREPIRAYLVSALPAAEAAPRTKPDHTTQREYDVNAALRVLVRFQDADDTPILVSYLRYPHPFVQKNAKALLDDRSR